MNKVNQYLFYEYGVSLSALKNLKGGEQYIDFILEFWQAQQALAKFSVETREMPLVLSRQAAQALQQRIQQAIDSTKKPNDEGKPEIDWEMLLDKSDIGAIQRKLTEFETVFSMEAQNLDVYSVTQKAGYKTDTLVQPHPRSYWPAPDPSG